jgi:hypothetical protein
MFTPSPHGKSTQRVCGPECRAKRDGKLQRARRRRDIDDHRADERERQRASRARRRSHAPPAKSKSLKILDKSERNVARPKAMSRASLGRQLADLMPLLSKIVANLAPVTRDLVPLTIGYQETIIVQPGTCHAGASTGPF